MKNLSGYEVVDAINLFEMTRKPIDAMYLGSELVTNEKLANGESMVHTFAALQDSNIKFNIWGFARINDLLCGNKEKELETMNPKTPIRLVYKGKEPFLTKKGQKCTSHQIDLFDISEEFEKKQITETKLNELVWA